MVEEVADPSPGGIEGALGRFAEQVLQLGEDLLDRVQVGAVGRQIEERRAGLATPARVPEVASAGPVRPGRLGGDGRFEKFILALQALQLDYGIGGIGASRTDRAERMRAAAEEIFKIDGVPQPVRPAADAAATVPEFQARPVDAAPIGIVSGAELAKPPSATPAAEPGPAATTAVADAPEG